MLESLAERFSDKGESVPLGSLLRNELIAYLTQMPWKKKSFTADIS